MPAGRMKLTLADLKVWSFLTFSSRQNRLRVSLTDLSADEQQKDTIINSFSLYTISLKLILQVKLTSEYHGKVSEPLESERCKLPSI